MHLSLTRYHGGMVIFPRFTKSLRQSHAAINEFTMLIGNQHLRPLLKPLLRQAKATATGTITMKRLRLRSYNNKIVLGQSIKERILQDCLQETN